MPIYKEGTVAPCPSCGKPLESAVEDYVVPGAHGCVGRPYKDQCGWCDHEFDVTRLANGEYQVRGLGSAD